MSWLFVACLLLTPELDLKSIPIGEWLSAGESTAIPWDIRIDNPGLRMDQRLEVTYTAHIGSRQLNRSGKNHELFLITRISTMDGEWLNEPEVLREDIEEELPRNAAVEFYMRALVQPGEYLAWLVLYDRATDKHNVARRRLRIPEINRDPLPYSSRGLPLVEFPMIQEANDRQVLMTTNSLSLPVLNKSPIEVQLISTLDTPEQWVRRFRMVRHHNYVTLGALTALSQMTLDRGSISITGLDLTRHQVLFEQNDFESIQWSGLMDALAKAQSPQISATALEDRKNNAAFFREFLGKRLAEEDRSDESPLRVFIVVTSSLLFENGSDLKPLVVEGDCHCRVYHLRFRLNQNDVFDELGKLMKPLRPRTFNLMTAWDLRKAIAAILDDLGNF